jgi:alpha-galactosidase
MLEIGNGGMSDDEYRTQISLWAILAAPLIASNDLAKMLPATEAILMNADVIAIDQDSGGLQGDRLRTKGQVEIWRRNLHDHSCVVAVFNRTVPYRGLGAINVSIDLSELKVPNVGRIQDVWNHADLQAANGKVNVTVAGHGVVLLHFFPPAEMSSSSAKVMTSARSELAGSPEGSKHYNYSVTF